MRQRQGINEVESNSKIKILLADDHAVVRESIHKFLSRQDDFVVIGECGDGSEAVSLARSLNPDVIVLDIAMPNLNGIEATKIIKKNQPGSAVLILTAYDYDEYVFAVLEAGAAGYLLKDINSRQLVDAIRAVNRGESILHPIAARKVIDHFSRKEKADDQKATNVLSDIEMHVLKLAAKGLSNKDIAAELCISVRTVEARLTNIFNKIGVGSRIEAVISGLKAGWFTVQDVSE